MKTRITCLFGISIALLFGGCETLTPPLLTASTPQEEVRQAAAIMRDFRNLPEPGIPETVLRNARGLAILEVAKGGAGITGRAGRGIVVARTGRGWSGPVFVATGGVGFGPQIGGAVTELVLVLNTQQAVEAFARGGTVEFTGDLSAAAGPVGRTAQVGAVPLAPVYSYSRSQGLFVGASIGGAAFVTRQDAIDAYYGRRVTPRQILFGGVTPPAGRFAF
jgi:lipid-binding SYLF domain-containing protein